MKRRKKKSNENSDFLYPKSKKVQKKSELKKTNKLDNGNKGKENIDYNNDSNAETDEEKKDEDEEKENKKPTRKSKKVKDDSTSESSSSESDSDPDDDSGAEITLAKPVLMGN